MINYNPKITQGGLVIDLDAANPRSYSGTGSVWTNIAPEGIVSGAMGAGITFNTMNGGCLYFDGSPISYVLIGTGATYFPMMEFTTEIWFKSSGVGSGMNLGGLWSITYGYQVGIDLAGNIYFSCYDVVNSATRNWGTSGKNHFDNVWHHLITVSDGFNYYVYIDGEQKAYSNAFLHYGTNIWTGNGVYIGNNDNDAYYFFKGYIAQARLYKRALSEQDVLNNFNAYRGRFGI